MDQIVHEHGDPRVVPSRLIPQMGVHVVLVDAELTVEAFFARWHYRRFMAALEIGWHRG